MMSELESLTPRSRVITNGHMTHSHSGHHHSHHHVAPPSFTVKLKDCQVEEGERLDLECTTQGECVRHNTPCYILLYSEITEQIAVGLTAMILLLMVDMGLLMTLG